MFKLSLEELVSNAMLHTNGMSCKKLKFLISVDDFKKTQVFATTLVIAFLNVKLM